MWVSCNNKNFNLDLSALEIIRDGFVQHPQIWVQVYLHLPTASVLNQTLQILFCLGTVLTVYLPTFLLICISYVTNFFKPYFFEAVVAVNLTCMLVLATMFVSVSDSLPKTSYIKMIDVWLIVSLSIPFFEVCIEFLGATSIEKISKIRTFKVLLYTAIDAYRMDENREVNNHGSVRIVNETENDNNCKEKRINNFLNASFVRYVKLFIFLFYEAINDK